MKFRYIFFITIVFICLLSITDNAFARFTTLTTIQANTFSVGSLSPSISPSPTLSLTPTPSIISTPSATPTPIISLTTTPTTTPTITLVPTPSIPQFATCPTVQGTIQASYATGMHAIVGMDQNQPGSDNVFGIGEKNYVQCYCPPTGTTGIQTNWLAAGKFSSAEKASFISTGWTLIAKGSDWGLSSQPYLAKNSPSVCPVQ